MKKISLLYILMIMGFMVNAQIQYEDFNGPDLPEGWSVKNTDSGHTWKFGFKGNLKGSGFENPASFTSGGAVFEDYQYGGFEDNAIELTGPKIDLVEKRIVEASIEITYNLRTFTDDGIFKVAVWDGETWQDVLTETGSSQEKNSGKNKTSTIDVSEFINRDFRVKFSYDDENSLTWGLGIDDYKLTGVVSSEVKGLENLGFVYFPNPVVNNELTLVSSQDISVVTIYNSLGQLVVSKKPASLESTLNLQHLASGAYMVEVSIGKNKGIFKIVKQ